MRFTLLLFLCLSIPLTQLYGQYEETSLRYGIGYWQNHFANPGATANVKYIIKNYNRKKILHIKKGTPAIVPISRMITGEIAFHYDPFSHVFLHNSYGIQNRRQGNKNRFRGLGGIVGFSKSFLPEVYKVDSSLNVAEPGISGNWYLHAGYTLEVGRSFKKNPNRAIILGFQNLFLIGYNSGITPFLNLSLTYEFSPNKKEH